MMLVFRWSFGCIFGIILVYFSILVLRYFWDDLQERFVHMFMVFGGSDSSNLHSTRHDPRVGGNGHHIYFMGIIYVDNIYYMGIIYVVYMYSLTLFPIQGGHFLTSALNRVLILAQECRGKTVQNRTGIMDLQNKSNILVAKQ